MLKNNGAYCSEAGGKYPPKVQVIARGERQIDRRNFKERRQVFDKVSDFMRAQHQQEHNVLIFAEERSPALPEHTNTGEEA